MSHVSQNRAAPRALGHWLLKSEPDEFSIDALAQCEVEPWSGVRNYQARNFMRDDMRAGDRVLFYHSSCAQPSIVGLARVASGAVPDPSQFDPQSEHFDPSSKPELPRWLQIDIAFERKLRQPISLTVLRQYAEPLQGLALLNRGNRLSVMPVSREHFRLILTLEPK